MREKKQYCKRHMINQSSSFAFLALPRKSQMHILFFSFIVTFPLAFIFLFSSCFLFPRLVLFFPVRPLYSLPFPLHDLFFSPFFLFNYSLSTTFQSSTMTLFSMIKCSFLTTHYLTLLLSPIFHFLNSLQYISYDSLQFYPLSLYVVTFCSLPFHVTSLPSPLIPALIQTGSSLPTYSFTQESK